MTTDEKTVEPTTTEKKVEDVKPEEKKEVPKEKFEEDIDNQIDYKAKAKEMEEAKDKAEKALASDRYKKSEEKRKQEDDFEEEEVNEEDKPITKKDLDEILVRQDQVIEQKVQITKVEQLVNNLTSNEDEAKLVNQILNDTKFSSGFSLEQRVKGAIAIANSDKIIGERDEAFRALSGKEGVSNDASGNYQKGQKAKKTSIADADTELVLKQTGFKINDQNGKWEKTLDNGKKQFYDVNQKRIVMA